MAVVAAVDDGDGADEEDGCVDEVVGTVAVAGIVDFAAFQPLTTVVVVDLDSSCSPVVLAAEAWFERDTTASC